VQYQNSCGSSASFTVTFNNQVVIQDPTFSDTGDSGSLIVDADTSQPVALLFAGDSSSGVTLANPIQDVLNALPDPSNQVLPTIVGGSTHPVGACVGVGPGGMTQKPTTVAPRLAEADTVRARNVKNAHLAALTSDPAVLGVGIGAGDYAGEAVIVVFVERGKAHQPIPPAVEGISTQIRTIGRLRAFARPTCSDKDEDRVPSSLTSLR
jgi:hypothetical protein